MPRATSSLLKGEAVSVDEALLLRELNTRQMQPRLDFRCLKCDKPVRPHKDGTHGAAHFEHFERNPMCPLSDPSRN